MNSVEDALPIRVINPGFKECVARQGTMAGCLTPIEEDHRNEVQLGSCTAGGEVQVPDHLVVLYNGNRDGVQLKYHCRITDLLCRYQDVFGNDDIGHTNLVQHHINVGNSRPIKERPWRFLPN